MRNLRSVIAVSALLWSMLTQTAAAQSESQTWSALANAYGAKKTPLGEIDKKGIAKIHSLAAEWNQVSTPLVRDALDSNVSAERWLQCASAPLSRLTSIYAEMQEQTKLFQDKGVRRTIQPSVAAHAELLAAYNQLRNALALGDAAKEQKAFKNLRVRGERKLAAGKPIFDRLRKSLGSDQVDQILEQEFGKLQNGVFPERNSLSGGAVDVRSTFETIKALAETGNSAGEYALACMYSSGQGVAKDEVEAAIWCRKAAEQGNADAQHQLGRMYSLGRGVAKDEVEGVKWYRLSAEQGNADGQFRLGFEYAFGDGVAKNQNEALKWYRKAAEQGNPDAQFLLAAAYSEGDGVAQNEVEAFKWFSAAAEQGNLNAQSGLGRMYLSGKAVTKDEVKAALWYQKAATQGLAEAQCKFGLMHFWGVGVTQNQVDAVNWYRKAADQGNADGQYLLGEAYRFGNGVAKDEAEGKKWYRKAAEQGHVEAKSQLAQLNKLLAQTKAKALTGDAEAQRDLGFQYWVGKDVTKDESEGAKWYRKAADQGLADAQYRLAVCYATGQGVKEDKAEAAKWASKAALQNDMNGQFLLGACYLNGNGVIKDRVQAHAWFNMSAARGHKDSVQWRDRLEAEMTSDQKAEATKLAREVSLKWETK